jgi:hypothetical protein
LLIPFRVPSRVIEAWLWPNGTVAGRLRTEPDRLGQENHAQANVLRISGLATLSDATIRQH